MENILKMTTKPQKQPINHRSNSKKPLLFLLCLFVAVFGYGQNLVPNPSFEEYSHCPDSIDGQIYLATGWKNVCVTPDYYNTCAINSSFSVPYNLGGYQQASNGNAYVGFYNYINGEIREIFGCQLIEPLTIGVEYFLSFKINLAFDPNSFVNYGASNKMGMLFSEVNYDMTQELNFLQNNFAHFFIDDIVTDTLTWTTFTGSFIPDSAYQYLYLGNFFNDINTDTLKVYQNIWNSNSECNLSYYYIDDIYVSTEPLSVNELESNVLIYPTLTQSKIFVKNNSEKVLSISMTNSIGKVVYEYKGVSSEFEIDISHLQKGTYIIYSLSENNKLSSKKIIIF